MKGVAIIALLTAFLLNSCTNNNKKGQELNHKSFFDLEAYFKSEISRLQTAKITIKKSITDNDKVEQKKISSLNWNEELALFIKGDINKPSWIEKYKVDSVLNTKGELTQLLYKTEEETMYTQMLDIKFQANKVHSIIIVNNVDNAVYASQQYLKYIPTIGYSLDKTQDVAFFDKATYKVEAEFIKP